MANTKISLLPNNATPQAIDLVPTVNTGAGQTQQSTLAQFFNVLSSVFRIKDVSDVTKQVAFNVSGITTGTLRTITIPDASDTLVFLTTIQTIQNKTIGAGTKIATGAETTGAMYYKDASGNLIGFNGTNGQILAFNSSNIPVAIPNPSASPATYTTLGVVQGLTDAPTSGLVISSGIISVNTGTGANNIVKLDASAKLPAVNGSALTNVNKIAISVSQVTVTNTGVETPIATISIPANTLGTANGVKVRIPMTNMVNAGSTSVIYKLKYGSTTLASGGWSNAYSGKAGFIDVILMANGATNSQSGSILVAGSLDSGGASRTSCVYGTSVEDSTTTLNLIVTVQFSASSSSDNNTTGGYIAERIS